MPLTDREHHDAYEALQAAFGDRCDTVIAMLRADEGVLATKADVAVLDAALRSDMLRLRTELKTEMADLRTELKTEMADLRTELKTEMADLRTDLKTEMSLLREDLGRQISAAFVQQTRALVFTMVSAMVVLALSVVLS